jgi:hypothetical protein
MFNSSMRLHTFAALLFASAVGWAAPHAQRPALEELVQALELSPDQLAPVRSLLENARDEREASRNAARQDRIAKREALDRQLATLLTPAQIEHLRVWRQAHPKPGQPQRTRQQGAQR